MGFFSPQVKVAELYPPKHWQDDDNWIAVFEAYRLVLSFSMLARGLNGPLFKIFQVRAAVLLADAGNLRRSVLAKDRALTHDDFRYARQISTTAITQENMLREALSLPPITPPKWAR